MSDQINLYLKIKKYVVMLERFTVLTIDSYPLLKQSDEQAGNGKIQHNIDSNTTMFPVFLCIPWISKYFFELF